MIITTMLESEGRDIWADSKIRDEGVLNYGRSNGNIHKRRTIDNADDDNILMIHTDNNNDDDNDNGRVSIR